MMINPNPNPSHGQRNRTCDGVTFYIVVTLIALVAIGALVAGGLLLQTHSLTSYLLLAGGAAAALIALIAIAKKVMKHSDVSTTNFIDCVTHYNENINNGIHGVYVLSNESGISNTMSRIEEFNATATRDSKCHLGVGGLHNFDIMAARRSDYGIIIDFNPHNKIFIDAALGHIRQSNTPAEFVTSVVTYMQEGYQTYNHYTGYGSPIERIQAELTRETSWLSNMEKFTHIKDLVVNNKICAITQDFRNVRQLRRLKQNVERNFHCAIDTIYLSNTYAYMREKEFYPSFEALSASNAITIHCIPPDNCSCNEGCQCQKVQHIARNWERVPKMRGTIIPIN